MEQQRTRESFRVVVNHEEQYSIWSAARELPLGWRDAGKTGSKEECLEHVREVWTDMRPKTLRDRMESGGGLEATATTPANGS